MNTDTLVMKAAGFAKKAHGGQKSGDGDYYHNHLVQVAHTYSKKFGYDSVGVAVCYLHDAIEDTCETYESIQYIFGDNIADYCNLLTKRSGESYQSYLAWLSDTKSCARVKWADSYVNLQKCIETEQWCRGQKYLKNLDYLKDYI